MRDPPKKPKPDKRDDEPPPTIYARDRLNEPIVKPYDRLPDEFYRDGKIVWPEHLARELAAIKGCDAADVLTRLPPGNYHPDEITQLFRTEYFAPQPARGITPNPGITERRGLNEYYGPQDARDGDTAAQGPIDALGDGIDVRAWKGRRAPRRRWLVREAIPALNVALFSGEGAIGKSTLMLQLCIQVARRKTDWLTWEIMYEADEDEHAEKFGAVYFCAEDDADELHRRVELILEASKADYDDLADRFKPFTRAGRDAVLAIVNRQGIVTPTALYRELLAVVTERRPKLVAIDTSADVAAINENDRAQVRQFIGLLRALAIAGGSAVLLAAHPSLTGITNDTGLSGSTAWFNSVRAQLNLKADDAKDEAGLRVLSARKNNYGPLTAHVRLRWDAGVYTPVKTPSAPEQAAKNAEVDTVFCRLLARFNENNQDVSPNRSSTYAPTQFARHADAGGISKDAFEKSMQRLIEAKRVTIIVEGTASKLRKRLRLPGGLVP